MSVVDQLSALDVSPNGQVDETLQRIAEEEVHSQCQQ